MSPVDDLRAQKEAFVSNLHGTTKQEIWLIISCLPVCIYMGELSTSAARSQPAAAWLTHERASGLCQFGRQQQPQDVAPCHAGALAQQHLTALAAHQGWQQWLLLVCFGCDFLAVVFPQAAVSMSAVGAAPLLLTMLALVVGVSTLPWYSHTHGATAKRAAAGTGQMPEAQEHTIGPLESDLNGQVPKEQAVWHHRAASSMAGWPQVAAELAQPRQR